VTNIHALSEIRTHDPGNQAATGIGMNTLGQGFSTGVSIELAIEKKNKHRFLNLLAKINIHRKISFSTQKSVDNFIGLLYLQLTDHANVP
jgi:hypothetical protein